jgi:hypothetical protein
MIRKRKPGGGRKPKGSIRGKSEVFTTRITPEVCKAIEREAESSGRSISQAAEHLLRLGLGLEAKRRNDFRSLYAICFVIERLALGVADQWWKDVGRHRQGVQFQQWLTDPFCYEAFAITVRFLLDELRPKGKIESPLSEIDRSLAEHKDPLIITFVKHTYESPDLLAAYVFTHLFSQVSRPNRDFVNELYGETDDPVAGIFKAGFYGFEDAHRDLKLGISDNEEKK